jgi:hypothetical protein
VVWDTEWGFGYLNKGLRWDFLIGNLYRVDQDAHLPRLFQALLAGSDVPLVPHEASWRWLEGREEPPADWHSPSFDDTSWTEGPAATQHPGSVAASRYLRHEFHLANPERLNELILTFRYDDAVVVYLNGHEVHRTAGLRGAGPSPAHDTLSRTDHEPVPGFVAANLSAHRQRLREGRNTLAVQAHRHSLETPGPEFAGALTGYVHDFSHPFRRLFADRVRHHLEGDGALTEDKVRAQWAEIARICRPVMPHFDQWEEAKPIEDRWLPRRGPVLLGQLRGHGLAQPEDE